VLQSFALELTPQSLSAVTVMMCSELTFSASICTLSIVILLAAGASSGLFPEQLMPQRARAIKRYFFMSILKRGAGLRGPAPVYERIELLLLVLLEADLGNVDC